jgi:hypothetical protein
MAKCCLIFVTVKVKFNLVQAMKFHKGNKGIALLFLTLHDRSMPHPGHFTPWERDPIPIVQEAIFVAVAMKSQKRHLFSHIICVSSCDVLKTTE